MTRSKFVSWGLMALLAAGAVWMSNRSSDAQDKAAKVAKEEKGEQPKKTPIQLFMRKKLEATQKVMEGLAIEDYDLIAQGARQLRGISAAADFAVVKEALYTQHADEFRRIVDRMEKQAKEKRLDGAALSYMDMTMSCVECHKFVRNILVTEN